MPVSSEEGFAKNIRRTCHAWYRCYAMMIDGVPPPSDVGISGLPRFTAEGGCGEFVPDRCRERAREAAKDCATDHWINRRARTIPMSCFPHNGVRNYVTRDIEWELNKAVCCRAYPSARFVTVKFSLWTLHPRSVPGCSSSRDLAENHEIDCSAFRGVGGCGPLKAIIPPRNIRKR